MHVDARTAPNIQRSCDNAGACSGFVSVEIDVERGGLIHCHARICLIMRSSGDPSEIHSS